MQYHNLCMANIKEDKFKGYVVTGLLHNSNKRFKPIRKAHLQDALFYNLWNGSVWGLLENGSRKLILRIVN